MTRFISIGAESRDADSLTLPADRRFREAWRFSGPVIEIDPEKAKPLLESEINDERDRRIALGLTVTLPQAGAVPVDTRDARDQANISGLVQGARIQMDAGDDSPVPFRAADNTTYQLTPADMVSLGLAALKHYSDHFAAAWAHKEAIAALESGVEVEAWDVTAGWPGEGE